MLLGPSLVGLTMNCLVESNMAMLALLKIRLHGTSLITAILQCTMISGLYGTIARGCLASEIQVL